MGWKTYRTLCLMSDQQFQLDKASHFSTLQSFWASLISSNSSSLKSKEEVVVEDGEDERVCNDVIVNQRLQQVEEEALSWAMSVLTSQYTQVLGDSATGTVCRLYFFLCFMLIS